MKRTFHFLLLLFCISTSASAQNYYDVSEFRDQLPELKQTDVVNFFKKDTNAFVTSCSLDTVSRILYYYHCYGGLFSYQPMSKPDMNAILAKKITPFEYFDLVTTFNVNLIEKAKKNLEDNGSDAKFTSLEKQYLDIADSVKFPSTLSKLLELDKQMVSLEVQDTRFHSVNPKYIKRDRSYYKTFNDLQGQMVIWRLSDSVATFYSKSDEPPVYKAVLDLKKAVICFYNRSDSLVDKIEINKSKVALLASKESDVFALYRMWLEWKRQSITQAIEETKKSGRVAENKQYALNVLSEQVKMLSAIDYKIEYFTNADKQFVLQKLRRQFGAIFAPNDPWETGRLVYHTRGDKRYELTDHRGNVMAVISDMKRGVPRKDNPALVDHYEAIVLGATDYTPFGNPMQGRSFNSDKYPYGYNGKEDDNETGYQNYGMRIYDPRVARFLSVDPLTPKYPELSSYQFASNSPISGIDKDGLEWAYYNKDNVQVNINSSTSNADKLTITGVKWAGYDKDVNGNRIPKAGTVATAYTFGLKGMTTSSLNSKGDGVQTWQSYSSLSTGNKTADKNILTLDPIVQNDMKELVLMGRLRFGIDVRGGVDGGYRTYNKQNELYEIGRTTQMSRKPVTYAKGGYSNHNFGLAMDIAIYENDEYLTNGRDWQYMLMGTVGKTKIQLEWGGDWKKKKFDPAHFQNTQGYSPEQLRALPKDNNGYILK